MGAIAQLVLRASMRQRRGPLCAVASVRQDLPLPLEVILQTIVAAMLGMPGQMDPALLALLDLTRTAQEMDRV